MNIFQTVKENVTARQAAEQYGLKINRNGMICCPFHDDRHPGLKVDKGFCCFACGTKRGCDHICGDFFHLAAVGSSKEDLAEVFQIPIFTDNAKKRNTSKKKEKPKRTLYQTEKKFEEWEPGKYPHLNGLSSFIGRMENRICTKNTRGRMESRIYRSLSADRKDKLQSGFIGVWRVAGQIEFLLDSGKVVKRIEERMEEYRRNNKKQTGRSIESREMNFKEYFSGMV